MILWRNWIFLPQRACPVHTPHHHFYPYYLFFSTFLRFFSFCPFFTWFYLFSSVFSIFIHFYLLWPFLTLFWPPRFSAKLGSSFNLTHVWVSSNAESFYQCLSKGPWKTYFTCQGGRGEAKNLTKCDKRQGVKPKSDVTTPKKILLRIIFKQKIFINANYKRRIIRLHRRVSD